MLQAALQPCAEEARATVSPHPNPNPKANPDPDPNPNPNPNPDPNPNPNPRGQASLYGATKESNERIAHVYHHLHGLRLTGLRFFTVYGPIGRPDMAYFSFTQDILSGRRITEYRKSDGTELQRDFTYVSDIVDGVIAAAELGAPLEVFNLGNTHPERVSTLIHLLEEGIGRKANISTAPISAGDVPITFADVSHARDRLGARLGPCPRRARRSGLALGYPRLPPPPRRVQP